MLISPLQLSSAVISQIYDLLKDKMAISYCFVFATTAVVITRFMAERETSDRWGECDGVVSGVE